MDGILWKKGRRLRKTIERWYFAHERQMFYTREQGEKGRHRKEIPLEHAVVKEIAESEELRGIGMCWGVSIDVEGEKERRLFARDKAERRKWFEEIRRISIQHSINNAYLITKDLGTGAFSEVKLGEDRANGSKWALKIIDRRKLAPEEEDMIDKERDILSSISHPNIVILREALTTQATHILVLEYLCGGELFERIVAAPEGKYTEREACRVIRQILAGIDFLHERNIAHRDLKPENFLLADEGAESVIKIADFGFATRIPVGTKVDEVCGSPGYVAPEVLKGEGYDCKADMWSLGVIIYILLTGIPPFGGADSDESAELTLSGNFDKTPLNIVSEAAGDVVKQMLVFNQDKRMSAHSSLSHPWLVGKEGGDTSLAATQRNLRSLLVRKRLKKAMLATMATTKMSHMLRLAASKKKDAENGTKDSSAAAPGAAGASGGGGGGQRNGGRVVENGGDKEDDLGAATI